MKARILLAAFGGSILIAAASGISAAAEVPSQMMLPAAGAGGGATDADALAKELSNPVASLISVPFQENMDFGYKGGGWKNTLNIQPVIPIPLNEDWTIIQRVVLPVIYQEDVGVPGTEFGFGDTVSSTFFSPKKPTAGGLIWGAGPVFYLPTATNEAFKSEKWGAGPTVVLLKQEGKHTYGLLANHIWSFAGPGSTDISSTFLQPFYSYGAGKGRTYGANFEATYDWKNSQWTIPLNLTVGQVLKLGEQRVSVTLGGRVYLDRPDGGPDWGLRFVFTLLFPE